MCERQLSVLAAMAHDVSLEEPALLVNQSAMNSNNKEVRDAQVFARNIRQIPP